MIYVHKYIEYNINENNFGLEQLDKEYKEIFLHNISIYFSEEELILLIKKNIIDTNKFNKLIISTLSKYILLYLPKYIGAFVNSNIPGKLYFGIDDSGNCIGIPFFGILDKTIISHAIMQTHIYLHCYYKNKMNKKKLNIILKNIIIEIYKISYNVKKNNDNNYNNYIKLNENIITEWNNYLIKYKKWHSELIIYSGKLNSIVKNIELKKDMILWIKSFVNDPKYIKYNLNYIIKYFENNNTINTDITYKKLNIIRYDYNSPLKWLMEYKDYKQLIIKKQKPLQPLVKPNINIHQKYCINIKNILYNLQFNKCNLFILSFNIPVYKNINIEYFIQKKNEWVYRYRILNNNGPSCI
jgi:hypothetical protein